LPPLRLLLLDNFDSYTHNLVHACAALCGTRPLVRFNTISAAELRELLRVERVDCVVVSPGPGRPDQPKDFGVCAHLYGDEEFKHVPVLG
jgi:para-aminobenzoate synthetase